VGRMLNLGRDSRQVIGVMPPGFTYPVGQATPIEAWAPMTFRTTDRDHGYGGRGYSLQVVGRLQPGATIEQARDQVTAATDRVIAAYPKLTFWKDARPVVLSLHDFVVGPAQNWLLLVLGAVALVLIIAYVNVANLLLARATTRSRELALRAALGASKGRVASTLVGESLMLSLAAAAMGIVLARWGVGVATASLPAGLARASTIALDFRVLGVAIGAALLTGLGFGVVPAWHGSRTDVMSMLKAGGASVGASRGGARWQRALLVAEIGFVVTLLVATTLFITSFVNVQRADLGFTRGRLVGVHVSRSIASLEPEARGPAVDVFTSDVLDRVRTVPGVLGAALVDGGLPLFGSSVAYSIEIDGYGSTEGGDMLTLKSVTPDYFDVAGVRLLDGRTFDGSERAGTPPVMIINEEAARRFFGGRSPVGEVVTFRGPTTVIGVVSSVRLSGPEGPLRPEMSLPLAQETVNTRSSTVSADVLVRIDDAATGTSVAVADAVKDFNPPERPPVLSDLDRRFRELTADRRFNTSVMTLFGLIALVIGAVGVYGLTSFIVSQQTRAFGVRIALGATAARIFRGVLTQTGRLLAMGLALGFLGGWAVSRLFASVVFGVAGTEMWLYGLVAAALILMSLLAAFLPARRASRVDPIVALRAE